MNKQKKCDEWLKMTFEAGMTKGAPEQSLVYRRPGLFKGMLKGLAKELIPEEISDNWNYAVLFVLLMVGLVLLIKYT